jgi:hypothetical protein
MQIINAFLTYLFVCLVLAKLRCGNGNFGQMRKNFS